MIEKTMIKNKNVITITQTLKLSNKHRELLEELDKNGCIEFRIYDPKELTKHQRYTQSYLCDLQEIGLIERDMDAWHETYRKPEDLEADRKRMQEYYNKRREEKKTLKKRKKELEHNLSISQSLGMSVKFKNELEEVNNKLILLED